MNSTLKRIICLLLCLCMTMGSLVLLSSCNDKGDTEESDDLGGSGGEVQKDGKVTVVRAITLLERGRKLIRANLEEVRVDPSVVPEGAITDIKEAINMYTNAVFYPGDYLFADKLSKEKDSSLETGADKYIVLTDHIKTKNDISGDFQKLINENPNSTIYIPDGTYLLAKSVNIPTEVGKAVSIRMSYRAVIQAASAWAGEKDDALLHIGSSKEKPAATKGEDTVSITGGIINTEGKAKGILVEGAGNVYISNMAVKKIETVGIHIKTNNVDVDNVVGTGTESDESTGVLVEGSYNTVSNMRIYKVSYGIKLTEGNNVLRNLHPLLSPSQCNRKNANETYGFYDTSKGNYYDYCYSDNLAIGFYLGDGNASILNGCFVYWYTDAPDLHWGAYAAGRFDAIIRNSRFDCCNKDECNNAYIAVENQFDTAAKGSKGMVIDPVSSGYNPYNNSNYNNNIWDSQCKLENFRKK